MSDMEKTAKKLLLASFIGAIIAMAPIHAAGRSTSNTQAMALKQMQDTLYGLQHGMNNHESQLQFIEEKFTNMEEIVDSLRKQLNDQSKGQKEQLLSSKANLDAKVGDLEFTSKGILSDLQTMKNHINESASLLNQYKQQFSNIEKQIALQNQNIENLQAAMKALMEAFQPNDSKESVASVYLVKSGDSLEKIANNHGTTIKAIKELNSLSSDRIRTGQKLKIPSK